MTEESKEKKQKKFWSKFFARAFWVLFFIFITLHIAGLSGYYEYQLHKNVIITEDKIKEFENDIANGKEVDIKNYLNEEEIDYTTNISKAGLYLSENFSDILKNTVETTFAFLNRLVEG